MFEPHLFTKRTIRIPLSWIRTVDEPPMNSHDNALAADDSLVVAASMLLPSVIPGDLSDVRLQGAILKVSLGGSLDLINAYQPGLDSVFQVVGIGPGGEIFAAGFVSLPSRVGGFGWVVKLEAGGLPIWERRVGEDVADQTTMFDAVAATSDGGVATLGRFRADGTTTEDKILVKLDADGALEFAKVVRGLPSFVPLHVVEAADGNLVVCSGLQAFMPNTIGVVMCRFDSSGAVTWQREFPDLVNPVGMVPLANGSVMVGATLRSSGSVIMKVDASGSVVGARLLGAQTAAGDPLSFMLRDLDVTSAQGIVVAGSASGESTVVARFDDTGQPLWGRLLDIDFSIFSRRMVHEIVLARSTTYLLSSGGASNAERGIEGLLLVRFDEHGDIAEDGCGLLSPIFMQASDVSIQVQNGALTIVEESPEVNPVASTVTHPAATSTTVCLHEKQIRFEPPFLEPPLTICFDEHDRPLPGIPPRPPRGELIDLDFPLKRSCNDDPGCLRCLQRLDDGTYVENPGWRADLYVAFRPFTTSAEARIAPEAADVLRSALAKVPTGRCFTDEFRAELNRRLGQWQRARARKSEYVPRADELHPHLAQVANLIDLDLLLPQHLVPETNDEGIVTIGSLARLHTRRGSHALSKVMARVLTDAPAPLPRGRVPGWPSLLWQLDVPDKSLDFLIELSYTGMRFEGPETALRMVQWRGGRARDITGYVDRANRAVVGHASGPGIFTVLEHRRNNGLI